MANNLQEKIKENAYIALKKYFGYNEFRSMQYEIIEKVILKNDCLVVMPTGGGKSLCFQIPALLLKGTAIVISPLIALMKDQVEALQAAGISAAFINSSQTAFQQSDIETRLLEGKLKLLYVSPEKITSESFYNFLKNIQISLFAIDEAHCISTWGHDFRPEYTQLSFLKSEFPDKTVMALTATADRITRNDIKNQLGISSANEFIDSFDRPNLSLTVEMGRDRLPKILKFIRSRPNTSGIIYCLARNTTEQLAEKLNNNGFKAAPYHAGLSSEQRSKAQEDFINDNVPIICATIAFGMGIDKSNVRWIIHYNLPKNIESYYQEIGRSGRDGLPSDTLLFYSYQDVFQLRGFINDSERKHIELAKLQRMQEYAEASVCRRKILLSYFNEYLPNNCNNCDVCKNPPESFDGTIIAQKAFSAIFRLNQEVPMNMLIDVLRGSARQEIIENNYHQIKTYGKGADISFKDWQSFIMQLINQGYIEIAYDNHNHIKLNQPAEQVLYKNFKVFLVQPAKIEQQQEQTKESTSSKKELVKNRLFEKLRVLRKQLADKKGVPPYIVFSDVSLEEMSQKKPVTETAFREIPGVGEQKLKLYGKIFIEAIENFILEETEQGNSQTGATYLQTYQLYKEGCSPAEIAQKRGINISTVFSHFATLIEMQKDINITEFINEEEIEAVANAVKNTGQHEKMKILFEFLNTEVDYIKIRLALSILKTRGKI